VIRNQALKCTSRLGDAKTAKEIFHKMKRNYARASQPNLITCNILIDMYVRLDMPERVDAVFRYMLAARIFPDSVTLTAMCAMYGKLGQPEKGEEMLQVIKDCFIRSDRPLVNAIVAMFCTCSQPERAAQILREMSKTVALDVASYSILLDCYAKRRELGKAEALLVEMVAAGVEPDIQTYTILLTMYAICPGTESLRKAKDIYAFVSERPHMTLDLVAYTVLIDTFAARGETEIVQEIYDAMLAKGLEPNAVIRTSISMLGIGRCQRESARESERSGDKESEAYGDGRSQDRLRYNGEGRE
jgi:pentatricopeptide repeat protein